MIYARADGDIKHEWVTGIPCRTLAWIPVFFAVVPVGFLDARLWSRKNRNDVSGPAGGKGEG